MKKALESDIESAEYGFLRAQDKFGADLWEKVATDLLVKTAKMKEDLHQVGEKLRSLRLSLIVSERRGSHRKGEKRHGKMFPARAPETTREGAYAPQESLMIGASIAPRPQR